KMQRHPPRRILGLAAGERRDMRDRQLIRLGHTDIVRQPASPDGFPWGRTPPIVIPYLRMKYPLSGRRGEAVDIGDLDVDRLAGELDVRLAAADAALAALFPGDASGRQPVHTVYVPADRYTAGLGRDWGERALGALAEHDGLFRDLVGDDDI